MTAQIHAFPDQDLQVGATSASVDFTVSDGSGTPADDAVTLTRSGVYPLQVEVRDQSGTPIATLDTFVVRLAPAPPAGATQNQEPLHVATELRLTTPPSHDARGAVDLNTTTRRRVERLVAGLNGRQSNGDAPALEVGITPELLDALAQSNRASDHALLDELRLATEPYALSRLAAVSIDLKRWLATPSLTGRASEQLASGSRTTSDAAPPGRQRYRRPRQVVDERLDQRRRGGVARRPGRHPLPRPGELARDARPRQLPPIARGAVRARPPRRSSRARRADRPGPDRPLRQRRPGAGGHQPPRRPRRDGARPSRAGPRRSRCQPDVLVAFAGLPHRVPGRTRQGRSTRHQPPRGVDLDGLAVHRRPAGPRRGRPVDRGSRPGASAAADRQAGAADHARCRVDAHGRLGCRPCRDASRRRAIERTDRGGAQQPDHRGGERGAEHRGADPSPRGRTRRGPVDRRIGQPSLDADRDAHLQDRRPPADDPSTRRRADGHPPYVRRLHTAPLRRRGDTRRAPDRHVDPDSRRASTPTRPATRW